MRCVRFALNLPAVSAANDHLKEGGFTEIVLLDNNFFSHDDTSLLKVYSEESLPDQPLSTHLEFL